MKKSVLHLWLIAALLCGMSLIVTSCKDDDKNDGNGNGSENDTEIVDANDTPERQMAWLWLWSLTDAEALPDNWDQQQYEATIGEESRNYANTRVIFVRDMTDARSNFSAITGCDPNDLKSAKTFSAGDWGEMAWAPSPQGADHIATVQVNSSLMPRLERIIYCTPDQADVNATSIKGTCYYRLGDVIEDKDGYYWVCIRPSFSQNKADDSYWVNIFNADPTTGKGEKTGKTPGVPQDNIYSTYNKKYNGNAILLPTALKSNREHMYMLSNLIHALLFPEDYKEKVGTQGKGLCGFDYQYHGANYLRRVNQYWREHGIWEKLFNKSSAVMKDYTRLKFFYNGYHWKFGSTAGFWIYTSTNRGYQSQYTGSIEDDDILFEMKKEGSGFDVRKFAHDPNYDTSTDGKVREENWAPKFQTSGGSGYWVVRFRTGQQIDKKYDPMKNMSGTYDIYRYNAETNTLAGNDVPNETEASIELYNDHTTVTEPYTGLSHYHLGDVYRDQYGRKWFVVSMSGMCGTKQTNDGTVVYLDNESSPWTELITFDKLQANSGNPATLQNAPSMKDAIRGCIFLWWLYMNSSATLEKGHAGKFSSTGSAATFRPAANIYEQTGVDIRYLFQNITAQNGDVRQPSQVLSVMYSDGSTSALNQKLLRVVCNQQNKANDGEFYIWSHYPKNPSSSAIKLKADAFSDIDIVLQDLLSQDMVERYAEDSYARQPLHAYARPEGSQAEAREPRKDTDSRAAKVENYFYNKETMHSFKFPADMWNSPVICFNMTRVKDRGDNDYSLTTEDGLNLMPVNLVNYIYVKEDEAHEFEDGVRSAQHLIYTQFDLVKVNGVKYSPYWKSVEDK